MASTSQRLRSTTPNRQSQTLLSTSTSQNIDNDVTRTRTATASSSLTPSRRTTLTPSRYIPQLEAQNDGRQQLFASTSSSVPALTYTVPSSTSHPTRFSEINNRVIASDPSLKGIMDNDCGKVDQTLRALRLAKSERRRAHESSKVELMERDRVIEAENEKLRREGGELVKIIQRERDEVDDLLASLSKLEGRKRALASQLEALKADDEEWTAKIRARREYNEEERKAYEQQASQDLPELSYLEEVSGLQIQGRTNEIVRFTFTLVDPSDHKRAFWIDLDAGDREYAVPASNPTILPSLLNPLLSRLNSSDTISGSGDVCIFLREVRSVFVKMAVNSRLR